MGAPYQYNEQVVRELPQCLVTPHPLNTRKVHRPNVVQVSYEALANPELCRKGNSGKCSSSIVKLI